MKEIKKWLS